MNNNLHKNNKKNPLPLVDQLNDSKLVIYRTSVGIAGKGCVSFYGISKFGLKCYLEQYPIYHKWTLPNIIAEKIADLHIPENRKIIENHIEKNPKDKELIEDTLFFGVLPDNESCRKRLSRHSECSKEDRKLALILKDLFPGHIGSYTQVGPGLSHSEVIIWDVDLNNKLHSTKSYDYVKLEPTKRKRYNNNNNSPSKTLKKDPYNSPSGSLRTPGSPHTPSGGGKKKKIKKLKSKKSKKRKNKKRSHKHKK